MPSTGLYALSPTEFQRSRHPQIFQDKIRVIHDGIDTERFKPSKGASVTLQKAGLIRYERGRIQITDRPGLEAAACECYGMLRRQRDRLLGTMD